MGSLKRAMKWCAPARCARRAGPPGRALRFRPRLPASAPTGAGSFLLACTCGLDWNRGAQFCRRAIAAWIRGEQLASNTNCKHFYSFSSSVSPTRHSTCGT